jgi:fructose-1-phosphate kinase PfkB-like protein
VTGQLTPTIVTRAQRRCSEAGFYACTLHAARLHRALNNAATAALMAAAAEGKGLVDDTCAKKAVAELTRT